MKTKKKPIRYDIIFAWSTKKRPFVTQKLSINASPVFGLAYKQAIKTKNMLWRAGGLNKKSVKIIGFSVHNVLQDYFAENSPYLLQRQAELKAQVKRFSKTGKDDSKAAKAAFKAKPIKLKDTDFKFTIGVDKQRKKAVQLKPTIQEKPEPMISATKPKKKVKK